jgi:hypothetical protein
MDKDIKETMDFLVSDAINIWELSGLFDNPKDVEVLKKMFPEPMFTMLKAIVKNVESMIEFHNENDDSAHEDIRDSVKNLEAKFRNHRHETGKTFSAKPEY